MRLRRKLYRLSPRARMSTNYFELFGLQPAYALDAEALTPRYRELQQQFHPDRFASGTAAEQAQAVQQAALINSAYQTLREPLARARYLLELAGHPLALESTTVGDVDFLAAQMELREELDEATTLEQLDAVRADVADWQASLQREFAADYRDGDWSEAADTVRKLQFLARLMDEVRDTEERLEDAELDDE